MGTSWPVNLSWECLWNWFGADFSQFPGLTVSKFVVSLWAIWFARNIHVMEGKTLTVWDICSKIESLIKELSELDCKLPSPSGSVRHSWLPPQNPNVKVNFDASYNKHFHQSCSGFIILMKGVRFWVVGFEEITVWLMLSRRRPWPVYKQFSLLMIWVSGELRWRVIREPRFLRLKRVCSTDLKLGFL